jgi:hypothetical protein
VNISFVDEEGHCHTPKKYMVEDKVRASNNTKVKMDNYNLILMFDHYMPNIIIDKSINTFTNKSLKLSSFISYLFKHDFLLDYLYSIAKWISIKYYYLRL